VVVACRGVGACVCVWWWWCGRGDPGEAQLQRQRIACKRPHGSLSAPATSTAGGAGASSQEAPLRWARYVVGCCGAAVGGCGLLRTLCLTVCHLVDRQAEGDGGVAKGHGSAQG
jgi:hypothetical protein